MKDATVSIRNLSMRFPGKRAGDEIAVLENVNADVSRGELVGTGSARSCGEATLLNIVGGFLKATSGEVTVEGQLVYESAQRRVVVLQEKGVDAWLNVHENVGFGL